jgi:ATP-dependent RNA helicase DHX37/DHR1
MTKEIETIQKRNKKKEKRLNIFIQKQLKKDERILLFKKLKDLKFDKNLLKSSKTLGKMSKREKLALSLNQERAGIELTEDVTLYHDISMDEFNYTDVGDGITETIGSKMNDTTETTVDSIDNLNGITETIVSNMDGITERTANGIKENENMVNGIERANESEKSLIERAFGSQKRPKPVVYESNPHGNTCIVEHDITVRKIKKRKKNKKKIKETVHEPEMTIHENIEKNTNETLETPIVPDTMHTNQPAYYVSVERDPAIQIARLALPVVGEEQPIMETIMHNNVTILCGETGSGKTTQVPQFLYEAGFGDKNHPKFPGLIGITQPRRVAAVSMANRVAQELNLHDGQVAYQIRFYVAYIDMINQN